MFFWSSTLEPSYQSYPDGMSIIGISSPSLLLLLLGVNNIPDCRAARRHEHAQPLPLSGFSEKGGISAHASGPDCLGCQSGLYHIGVFGQHLPGGVFCVVPKVVRIGQTGYHVQGASQILARSDEGPRISLNFLILAMPCSTKILILDTCLLSLRSSSVRPPCFGS